MQHPIRKSIHIELYKPAAGLKKESIVVNVSRKIRTYAPMIGKNNRYFATPMIGKTI